MAQANTLYVSNYCAFKKSNKTAAMTLTKIRGNSLLRSFEHRNVSRFEGIPERPGGSLGHLYHHH